MDLLQPASRRRRRSSVVVVLCFVIVVADFIPHHSAAASDTDVAEQLDNLAKEDSDNDKNKLIAAAKGTFSFHAYIQRFCIFEYYTFCRLGFVVVVVVIYLRYYRSRWLKQTF